MRSWRDGMVSGIVIGAVASALLAPTAQAASTPQGPATLSSVWRGAHTLALHPPHVLQSFTVTVEAGGSAGLVRLRASDRATDPGRGVVLGDWVTLPAEPGRYTFPAPRVDMDGRSLVLALDQQTGGHEIVDEDDCPPPVPLGRGFCESVSLDVWTPMLADHFHGAPPGSQDGAPPPSTSKPGARLRIATTSEVDVDRDLAGDRTEDRTDLVVSGSAVRGRDGRLTITVTNRGPRPADLGWVSIDRPEARGWTPGCSTAPVVLFSGPRANDAASCRLPVLAPGSSTTVSLATIDDGRPLVVTAESEGPDLVPTDNTVSVVPQLAPPPAASVSVAARARARRGVRVRVRSDEAGKATLRLSVRYRGKLRETTRTIALRAGAARSVALRLARVGRTHPAGRAQLAVTIDAPAHETRTLQRVVRLVADPVRRPAARRGDRAPRSRR